MILGLVKRLLWFSVEATIIILVLGLIPGLPPYVEFPSYNLTPARVLEGNLEPNHRLDEAECLYMGQLTGPESIAFRGDDMYTGLLDGHVAKIDKNGKFSRVVKFGQDCAGPWEERKCGRPLGLTFDKDGTLLVADAYYGLFRVDVDKGTYQTLASSFEPIDGKRPKCPNSVDVADDGTVYWTDSSTFATLDDGLLEFLSAPSGRLLKYDPRTNQSTVLVSGVHFANGIKLSPKQDYLVFSELGRARIIRYHLKGKKKGQKDVFLDGLPGIPDNIRSNERGGYYIAMFSPRIRGKFDITEFFADKPTLRRIATRLLYTAMEGLTFLNKSFPNVYIAKLRHFLGHPEPASRLQPRHAIVLDVDGNGQIIGSLQAMNGQVAHISEATVHGDYMYLGSPYNECLYRVRRQTRVNVKSAVGGMDVI